MKKTSKSAESTSVDLDASIQRLIVVSDLHAYREPLEVVDSYLEALTGDYRVFVNGDFFDGGMDAVATLAWVRTQATGRTTRGNHDRGVFDYLRDAASSPPPPPERRPADTELGSYQRMSPEQLQFVADLPDQLLVHWRGKRVRILHGHRNLKTEAYTSFLSSVDQLVEVFHDTSVDLTVIGHTHYPFARKQGGSWVANSGSVAVPICRMRAAEGGAIENRCATDDSVDDDNAQSSLLSITESGGELDVQVIRFDYDQRGLLERYAREDGLHMRQAVREQWITQALLDL
jgi:predicted phosphodiesterase